MGSRIIYKRAESDQELTQILELQRTNYSSSISIEEKKQEGFVTVVHDFDILKKMNDTCAHIIAKHQDTVVGYALCMLKAFKDDIEVLKPMFHQIDTCLKPDQTYMTMGQICIDKAYRKQGIFRGLYNCMKENLQLEFDMVITEVDLENTRSVNAHYAVGFKLLQSYQSNRQDWALISWDLR